METAPQRDLKAEVVKDMPSFGPEQWSFFGAGAHPNLVKIFLFFGDHLILAEKTLRISDFGV